MTVIENKRVTVSNAALTRNPTTRPISLRCSASVVDSPTAETCSAFAGREQEKTKVSHPRKKMTIKALVMSDRSDEYTGKRGLVKQQIITVMDQSEGERLAQPVEYALSDEEKAVHAGKLQDKLIHLGIRELLPFGGRLRARGKIVGLVGK
ncbi:MAG TPA: hypothetical protein VH413_01390 [Verrucomicrobiae bacterium]|jgi:hypothetical protein|nr:hypothetical protein [Verrucomicrobiae bacterium]